MKTSFNFKSITTKFNNSLKTATNERKAHLLVGELRTRLHYADTEMEVEHYQQILDRIHKRLLTGLGVGMVLSMLGGYAISTLNIHIVLKLIICLAGSLGISTVSARVVNNMNVRDIEANMNRAFFIA